MGAQAEGQRFLNKQVKIGETRSADEQGGPGSLSQSGFAVYCNAEGAYRDPGSATWREEMSAAISRNGHANAEMTYVLGPQALTVRASIDKESHYKPARSRVHKGKDGAMNEIDAHIEEVRGVVRQKQIKIALNTLSWIENVWNFKNMTALRPTGAFEGNTRRWWRFAIEVHQIRVQQARQNFRWSEVKRTFRLAKEYIALYQRKCRDDRPWLEDLSETELERLDTIESSGIGYKALSEWRCIAWDKLCEEDAKEYKRRAQ